MGIERNTIIAQGTAVSSLVEHKIINENLVNHKKDSLKRVVQKPYEDAPENLGREQLGGVFVKGIIDLSHPLGFGYTSKQVSLYKNNLVWIKPSKTSMGHQLYIRKNHMLMAIYLRILTELSSKSSTCSGK